MPRLDGKIAVVTGAAAGPKAALGAIFAKALPAEGAICAMKNRSVP